MGEDGDTEGAQTYDVAMLMKGTSWFMMNCVRMASHAGVSMPLLASTKMWSISL